MTFAITTIICKALFLLLLLLYQTFVDIGDYPSNLSYSVNCMRIEPLTYDLPIPEVSFGKHRAHYHN